MTFFEKTKVLPFSERQLYSLVVDVEKYSEFVPGVKKAYVYNEKHSHFHADLTVGKGAFQVTYTSLVTVVPPLEITTRCVNGPLDLESQWHFLPLGKEETQVVFRVNFSFHGFLLGKIAEGALSSTIESMMEAFEKRAHQLFKS